MLYAQQHFKVVLASRIRRAATRDCIAPGIENYNFHKPSFAKCVGLESIQTIAEDLTVRQEFVAVVAELLGHSWSFTLSGITRILFAFLMNLDQHNSSLV